MLLAPFCIALLMAGGPAQSAQDVEIEPGTLLVASRNLRDPNFAQSVVLIVADGNEGTLGIVVNRRGDLTIARAFPDWTAAKGRTEALFLGGPITNTILTLSRTKGLTSDDGVEVLAGVQMIPGKPALRKVLAAGTPGSYRIYVGYAGWGPEQLDDEIEAGAWQVVPGNHNLIFDPDPDTLWSRLNTRAETQIARLQLLHCPVC